MSVFTEFVFSDNISVNLSTNIFLEDDQTQKVKADTYFRYILLIKRVVPLVE